MTTPAYLNGDYRPLEELAIPVMDRGFLFSDGVYEMIPIHQGRPRCLADHLTRLRNSLAAIQIQEPSDWDEIVGRLIEASPDPDCLVYLQVTRGVMPSDAPFVKHYCDTTPTVFGMVKAMGEPPDSTHAITREDRRWGRCFIKSTMLLDTVMATQSAREQNAGEAILHRNGNITEGATSNVFAVVEGMIRTPELGPTILPGVTRKLALQLLREHGVEYRETDLSLEEMRNTEEVWLTGSTRGIMPVIKVDDAPIGDGTVGPMTEQLRGWYQEYCLNG